jgi:3-polyprenyl-4-hydroxybenzoate decarboxylase
MTGTPTSDPDRSGGVGTIDSTHLLLVGAGPGLGMAVARRFAVGGYRVTLVARSTDKLGDLAGSLSDTGAEAILPVVAAGPPVEEDHMMIGVTGAAETLYELRKAGLPIAHAWYNFEALPHWLTIAVRSDWHEGTGLASHELIERIADVLFHGKWTLNIPKTLVVEDDVDVTDVGDAVWAFATRSHPDVARGEFHFPPSVADALAVYLTPEEQNGMKAGKVIYNCLLADLYPSGKRPAKANLAHGWPKEIQQRVLDNWHRYGYPAR